MERRGGFPGGWRALALVAVVISVVGTIPEETSTVRANAPLTRVFATFVSHNEEATNATCAPVITNRDRYLTNRTAVVELARRIVEKGAAWDLQSEWQYLQAVQQWDDDATMGPTLGKNIIRYLAELSPEHVAVDAHSHENSGWNYADVAYQLTLLGAPPTGIVGGYIANPPSAETWTRLRKPLQGLRPPYPVWQAVALWGGGSAYHRDDPRASGIWRPRDAEHFFEDDPGQALFNIGSWTGDLTAGEGLTRLLEMLRTGRLEEGRLYTATIGIQQCRLDADPSLMSAISGIVDRFAADVATGDLVWATLPTVGRVWREEYGQAPAVLRP